MSSTSTPKKENKRLGKGIEALFSANNDMELADIVTDIEQTDGYQVKDINSKKLRPNPFQPRKAFDETALQELADSIKEHGIIQPIIVRKSSFGYDILAGERRFRASKLAGLDVVPAVVKEFDDAAMMELALLENVQREDLNIIEEANGYKKLLGHFSWTQEELAKRMGKSRSHITNILRLLELPTKIQDMVRQKTLSMGHVKVLVGLPSNEAITLAEHAVNQKLSVRETENLVKQKKTAAPTKKVVQIEEDIQTTFIEEKLIQFFGTKVAIGTKKLTIHFQDTADLNRILEKLDMLDE